MTGSATNGTIEPLRFREVLGRFPTGVVIVAATGGDGPVGMLVGSFASVSLDPPLVGFLPAKTSRTWPEIRATGTFAISVLGSDQAAVCEAFSASGSNRFGQIAWHPGAFGDPVADGCPVAIECEIAAVHEVGDHDFVVGRVLTLDLLHDGLPLVFYRGTYRQLMRP